MKLHACSTAQRCCLHGRVQQRRRCLELHERHLPLKQAQPTWPAVTPWKVGSTTVSHSSWVA